MKVLQVLGTSAGGVGRHVHDLVEGLIASGDLVTVACPAAVEEQFRFAAAGADHIPLAVSDRPHLRRDAETLRLLRRTAGEVDVVHAHGVRAGGLAALARTGKPLVVTLHNAAPETRSGRAVHGALEQILARGADVVLGVSSDLVASARRRGARHVAPAVVPAAAPGVVTADRYAVRAALGVGPRTGLGVCVARLAPQKDLGVLLDALAEPGVWQDTDVLVVVAGEGPERGSLERRIADLGVPVRLLGARDDVPDLLAAADVVVSTARWEGQPVALQEALHAGAAIVATDAGGTADVVGDAAILVPVGDAQSLARALRDVFRHGSVRDDLRSKAVERAGALSGREEAIAAVHAAYELALSTAAVGEPRRFPGR